MARVFLSLGSNKGDRLANIQQAVSMLSMCENVNILKSSSFYETEPWGYKNQAWFLNAAVALDTTYSALELLDICQNIERQLGRTRLTEKKWQERTIDIDILFYDDCVIQEPDFCVPHVDMQNRDFVLKPLCEIAPYKRHPVYGWTVSEMLLKLSFK